MSRPKTQLQRMTCVEVSGCQPLKCDHRFQDKFTNFSPLPLTPLECPYENFPPYRIFSICHPLADGGESVRISAPTPEIGGPKKGKFWGACCKNSKPIVFRVFAHVLPTGSSMGRQNFRWGRDPLPEILAKNHFAMPISTRDANFNAT